jgi:hypothetical protein
MPSRVTHAMKYHHSWLQLWFGLQELGLLFMLMFLGHTAGQQMCVGENYGSFLNLHKVIWSLICNFSLALLIHYIYGLQHGMSYELVGSLQR